MLCGHLKILMKYSLCSIVGELMLKAGLSTGQSVKMADGPRAQGAPNGLGSPFELFLVK